MKHSILFLLISLSSIVFADSTPIIEEKQVNEPFFKKSLFKDTSEGSFFSSRARASEPEYASYDSTLSMREKRRVGVGFQIAGQSGLAGLLLELNITPENSALLGFGGGPNYNTFNVAWKYIFGGRNFAPYFSTSFSRWYSSGRGRGGIGSTNPSFLADKWLSSEEVSSGVFAKDLLIPALGLQLNQLRGPYAGVSLYTEIMLAVNVANLTQVPIGTMGMLYYF